MLLSNEEERAHDERDKLWHQIIQGVDTRKPTQIDKMIKSKASESGVQANKKHRDENTKIQNQVEESHKEQKTDKS
jgi:hypothetical protein